VKLGKRRRIFERSRGVLPTDQEPGAVLWRELSGRVADLGMGLQLELVQAFQARRPWADLPASVRLVLMDAAAAIRTLGA